MWQDNEYCKDTDMDECGITCRGFGRNDTTKCKLRFSWSLNESIKEFGLDKLRPFFDSEEEYKQARLIHLLEKE